MELHGSIYVIRQETQDAIKIPSPVSPGPKASAISEAPEREANWAFKTQRIVAEDMLP